MKQKILYCLLASFIALSGCNSDAKKDKAKDAPKTVEIGFVELSPQYSMVKTTLTGRVVAVNSSEVRPQASGIVRQMLFKEGAYVKAGQALYQLDTASYKASYDQQEAQLANARATLEAARLSANRYRSLSDMDAVSLQDRDDAYAREKQAIASVKLAEANLRSTQIDLRYTTVRAPISGYISASNFTVGALVTASQATPLATIRQLDPIYIDIQQSSADILRLRKSLVNDGHISTSAPINIYTEDGSLHPHQGQLQFGERMVNEDTGSVTLRAKIPNPEGYLLPGMFVKAEMPQMEIPDAILAPQQGIIIGTGNQGTAYVVTAENKVEMRQITMGQAMGNQWLIISGLKTGDKLIVEGREKVKDGDTVKAVKVDLNAPQNTQQKAPNGNAVNQVTTPEKNGK